MLLALVTASGAAALILQVLWARDWALLYGTTAVGTAVVLAAYFAGLAVGAAVAARMTGRMNGLALYAALEATVAVLVLGYLLVRPLLPSAAVAITRATPTGLLPLVRTALAFAILLGPAALLGATLPAAAATLRAGDVAGVGRLYAWNTLGGALGALACGALLVRLLGVRASYLVAAGLDLAVAAAAWRFARKVPPTIAPAPTAIARPAWTVTAVAAATGFVGLALEVLWMRALAGVMSGSVYSIALTVAAVLAGIVLGSRAAARYLVAVPGRPPLAAALGLLALAIVASGVAIRGLPAASRTLVAMLAVAGPASGFLVEAALAALIVFVPAAALGAVFPLTVALAGPDVPGRATGEVLAANTAGGIAGALTGAFLLLPTVGLGGGILVAAAIVTLAAAALADGASARLLVGAAAAVVALSAIVAPRLEVPWHRPPDERIVLYRDGAAATVMVTEDARHNRRLRINGQYALGGTEGRFLEARLGLLPVLLHPSPRRLLALGIGTGNTVGAAAAAPELEVEGVELVAEALEAAVLFAPENGGVLANERVRFVVDDARSFLLAAAPVYDVILSDLFLPWTAGTSSLYSADFFREGLARLRPGGLWCQWLPLHQLAVPDLETIVATSRRRFPRSKSGVLITAPRRRSWRSWARPSC